MLYNNVPGLFAATVAGRRRRRSRSRSSTISDTDGAELVGRIATPLTGTVDITWTDQTGIFVNPTAGQPSSFTSWGLAPTLGAKPDIAAPGGLIKSTWPLENGGIATISGTSMAARTSRERRRSPRGAREIDPLLLREILQNNAVPSMLSTRRSEPRASSGRGTLQIDDAILASARVTPGKLSSARGQPRRRRR